MKDEIAHEIATELRLIREELQKLTGAIKSSTNRSGNSYTGNSRKSYQARAPFPPESGQPGGPKQQRNPRGGEPRRQWHLHKRYEMSEGLTKLLASRKVAGQEGNLKPSTSNPGKRIVACELV